MYAVPTIYSFPPIADANATTLILGSIPGAISLQQQQYYAHPRNAFWFIAAELFGFDRAVPYAARLDILRNSGIALWDVLHACLRDGSLDADIQKDSIVPNNFAEFFAAQPQIRHVFFNGAKAEAVYRQRVLPLLAHNKANHHDIIYTRLPSTSPAHAAMSMPHKLEAWRVIATR